MGPSPDIVTAEFVLSSVISVCRSLTLKKKSNHELISDSSGSQTVSLGFTIKNWYLIKSGGAELYCGLFFANRSVTWKFSISHSYRFQ